ncbi:MAG: hypothetical protein ACRDAM_02285 [Casimicrobium sp.]
MTIHFTPGTVYDVAHLREFDLELALQGHPLATFRGQSVRAFRAMTSGDLPLYALDIWDCNAIDKEWSCSGHAIPALQLEGFLRLAPLAVKNGRPLHVGDEIKWAHESEPENWRTMHAGLAGLAAIEATSGRIQWRWPERKE